MNKLIVIAGPTASGKSALALALAQEFGGVVINADAMQVYKVLRVLTARPEPAGEALVPHRLYGILPPSELCSAGRWQALAATECQAVWNLGRLPIIVGGTGLYLHALLHGLSPIPSIPDSIRQETRALFQTLGNESFYARLSERDPRMAARLHPANSQRLVRAWEVLEATGRSLADWQTEPALKRLETDTFSLLLMPPRPSLYAACNGRFLTMIDRGGLQEVQILLDKQLDPALPVMKALGVPELARHLLEGYPLDAAIRDAQSATRHYAKRQMTWFRHQLTACQIIDSQFSESFIPKIFANIRQFLLTGNR